MMIRSPARSFLLVVLALAAGYAVVLNGVVQTAARSPLLLNLAARIARDEPAVLSLRARDALLQAVAKDKTPPAQRTTAMPADSAELRRAGQLARRALGGDLTQVNALAIHGAALHARGDARAGQVMRTAASLRKRNLISRLWLIEDAAKRDSARELLRHVDIALRVSATAQEQMFPLLARALSDPAIVPPFVRVLRDNPPWAEAFLYTAISGGNATGNVARIYAQVGKAYAHQGQPLAPLLMEQLVAQQLYAEAFALGEQSGAANGRSVADPGFARAGGIEPLNWQLRSTSDFDAARSADSFGQTGLAIVSSGSGAEVVARQLLRLSAGDYRFANAVKSDLGEISLDLEWRLRCAASGVILGTLDPTTVQRSAAWRVPAQCGYQWLELYVDADAAVGGETVLVLPVSLKQSAAGTRTGPAREAPTG